MSPPIVATVLRRIDKNSVLAAVSLRLPRLRLTLLGCTWLLDGGTERIVLPRRQWTDKNGATYDAEIFVFDDTIVQRCFESLALDAVHVLRQVTTR